MQLDFHLFICIEVLKRVFDKFDYDKSGFISPRELTNVFNALGLNNSEKACQDVFKQIDSNNSREIDFEEFFRLMQPTLGGQFTREQLSDAFRSFDKDKSGQISVRELSSILSALGQYYDDKQIARLIAKVDKNSDGHLSFEGICFLKLYFLLE
jgi:Ca2+-binding EF-hand superfamily protein